MNRRAIQIHDVVNLWAIPFIGLGTILGMLLLLLLIKPLLASAEKTLIRSHLFLFNVGIMGLLNPVRVSEAFAVYVLVDFVWLIVQPEAVPSLPNVILGHHVVTMILLYFPLKYNELAIYTCWDGLCEINTFFLIGRRQFKPYKKIMDILYWATFIPSRTIIYPIMLYEFYSVWQVRLLDGGKYWEMVTCLACQTSLIVFNIILLYLGVVKHIKKRKKTQAAGKDA